MKTTLRYLLMALAMVSVLSVWAQNLAQQPVVEMKSTSVMVGTGSSLPQAAATGAMLTGDTPGSYSPARAQSSKPRRSLDDGDNDIETQGQPFPLGDALWPLMLLALAYVGVRVFPKRKRACGKRNKPINKQILS